MTKRREPVFCKATSKQTFDRCRRKVLVEGQVCRWHGGAAPLVRAKQELQRALGRDYVAPMSSSNPADVVRKLLATTEAVVGQLMVVLSDVGMAPADKLEQAGGWMDRLARFAKLTADMAELAARLDAEQAEMLVAVMVTVLEGVAVDLGHDPEDQSVRAVFHERLGVALAPHMQESAA